MGHIPILGEDESEGNKHPHWEWRSDSPEMGMYLTGNKDVPHREWGCDSPGMHILTGNAHSLYRVLLVAGQVTVV